MADDEAPCLAAPALSLPLRPCSPRGDDRSREGEPSNTSRSERLGTVASVAGRRIWMWTWPGTTPTFDPPIRQTGCWWCPSSTARSSTSGISSVVDSWTTTGSTGPITSPASSRPRSMTMPGTSNASSPVKDFRRRVRGRSSTGARSGLRRRSTGPARCVLSRRTRGDPLVPAPGVHLRRAPAQQWRGASCHRCLGDGPLPDVRRGA
jgi:hypothetical protein